LYFQGSKTLEESKNKKIKVKMLNKGVRDEKKVKMTIYLHRDYLIV
jgi:hypothetical protein